MLYVTSGVGLRFSPLLQWRLNEKSASPIPVVNKFSCTDAFFFFVLFYVFMVGNDIEIKLCMCNHMVTSEIRE